MNTFRKYKFNSIMINSFNPGEGSITRGEPICYHYTSPAAFMSIIKGKNVYFSDIMYLNDKEEDVYLKKLIKEYYFKNKNDLPKLERVFDYLIGDTTKKPTSREKSEVTTRYPFKQVRKFVFCMSKEDDSLPMWNYYVNNGQYQGFNIGFNIEKLLKTFDTKFPNTADPFSVLYGAVLYGEKEPKQELANLFDEIQFVIDFNGLEAAKAHLAMYIDRYSPFYKNDKFAHEKEYRIVIEINDKYLTKNGLDKCFGENNRKIQYDFLTRQGMIVPYLNVSYNDDSVSKIRVSPITEYNIAQESIKELLRVYNYKSVRVRKSDIPIRF